MIKILFITDTMNNNFNGVVNLIHYLTNNLKKLKIDIQLVSTDDFSNFKLTNDVRLAFPQINYISKLISKYQPNFIHIFTEGSLGLSAKLACDSLNLAYTTSFNTQFDYYLKHRYCFPLALTRKYLNYFHAKSAKVFVPTLSVKQSLINYFSNQTLTIIGRGVDQTIFHCDAPKRKIPANDPLCIYTGRVVKEKNLDCFLNIKSIKRKIVIGDGPMKKFYSEHYPDVDFIGFQPHKKINEYYNASDIFVFPSKTDTFGQVLLEAMICGLPIAAYPVNGPKDNVIHEQTGYLHDDLEYAIHQCKTINRENCINHSKQYTWENVAQEFLSNLAAIN